MRAVLRTHACPDARAGGAADLSRPGATASRDVVVLGALAILLLLGADMFNLHEGFARWIGPANVERYQLDEVFMVSAALAAGLGAFAFRRWGDARAAIARYDAAERTLRESENRLAQILDALPVAVTVYNVDGSTAYQNRLAMEWFGPAADSPSASRGVYRVGTSSPYPADELPRGRAIRGERAAADDVELRHGAVRRVLHELAVPLLDSRRQIAQAVVVAGDLTDRRAADAALQASAEQLSATVAALTQQTADMTRLGEMVHLLQACPTLQDAYAVIPRSVQRFLPDASGAVYILDASRTSMELVTSWGPDAPPPQVFGPEACWAIRRGQLHVVEDVATGWVCPHVQLPLAGGRYTCAPLTARGEAIGVLYLAGPRPQGAAAARGALPGGDTPLAAAIADQLGLALANLRLWETLRTQSIRDPLTGLYNRRFMEDAFERELRRAGRSHRALGCIMFDLDHFKPFNDAFGHQAGDTLLRALGGLVRSVTRGDDVVCRYGGEEFVWILPEASRDDAMQRAEELRAAVEKLAVTHLGQGLGTVTVSLGVSVFPEHGETVDALLRQADLALYQAKSRGRNRVEAAGAA